MIRKSKSPFIRDVYLAYLIKGARRTETFEFPVIEKWMVALKPPKEIIQWDRRRDVINPKETAICFYCCDPTFVPILSNPKGYIDKLKEYEMAIGIDASPYDNMPLIVQLSQIYLNLAVTYYYASNGIKVIPNVRLGDMRTLCSLKAYPHGTLIAIGTHGFIKRLDNRVIFKEQIKKVVDELSPTGICVYGPASDELFGYVKEKGIAIYQYDSYTMTQNKIDKYLKQRRNNLWKGKIRYLDLPIKI